jgi:hypothetical protein
MSMIRDLDDNQETDDEAFERLSALQDADPNGSVPVYS